MKINPKFKLISLDDTVEIIGLGVPSEKLLVKKGNEHYALYVTDVKNDDPKRGVVFSGVAKNGSSGLVAFELKKDTFLDYAKAGAVYVAADDIDSASILMKKCLGHIPDKVKSIGLKIYRE